MNTPLTQIISDSVKRELDVDTFLKTLTLESAIDNLKQFCVSSWFLLKIVGAVFFMLATQIYKLGQQIRVYFQPNLTSVATKIYNYCTPINHPVSQFIASLLSTSDDLDNDAYEKTFYKTTPLTDSNGNPLTIRIQTDQTYESLDSQKQPSTHLIS